LIIDRASLLSTPLDSTLNIDSVAKARMSKLLFETYVFEQRTDEILIGDTDEIPTDSDDIDPISNDNGSISTGKTATGSNASGRGNTGSNRSDTEETGLVFSNTDDAHPLASGKVDNVLTPADTAPIPNDNCVVVTVVFGRYAVLNNGALNRDISKEGEE